MEVYRISQIIEELKRIQVEKGNVPVVIADISKIQKPTWPIASKDKFNNDIVIFN